MSSKIKNILIVGGIGAVLILGYFLFFKKAPDQPALVSSTGNAVLPNAVSDQTSTISKDFLAVLLNVKGIKIDDSIFTDPAFLSLNDSSIELVSDGTEGRPNPFAPLGSDVSVIVEPILPPTFPTDISTFPTIPTTQTTGSGN